MCKFCETDTNAKMICLWLALGRHTPNKWTIKFKLIWKKTKMHDQSLPDSETNFWRVKYKLLTSRVTSYNYCISKPNTRRWVVKLQFHDYLVTGAVRETYKNINAAYNLFLSEFQNNVYLVFVYYLIYTQSHQYVPSKIYEFVYLNNVIFIWFLYITIVHRKWEICNNVFLTIQNKLIHYG